MITAKIDRLLWRIPTRIPEHQQSHLLDTSSGAIRVRDSGGDGKALIFLCDPPITVEAYDELITCFDESFRVIILELPSFGFSSITTSDALSFEGAVLAVETALISLKLDACIVFGPCVCGFVATELVARDQLPIKGLVLMQMPDRAGMLSWVDRMDPKGLLRIPILGQLIVRFTGRRISKFWLRYATAKKFDSSELVTASDSALHQGAGYPLASLLQLWPKGTKDANLDVPALAIWGKQDRSHAETASSSTCKHVPNAQIVEFSECGHFTELEQPAEFVAVVDPFISKVLGKVVVG